MLLKENILKCIVGYRATSQSYIDHLRKIGVFVGEDVKLFRPMNTTIDIQNPHLLTIGNHVMITGPVTILTHDYSWSVLKRKYGVILGNQQKTVIEDNVFIGWGSTILAGSYIGSNSIIGANSVVTGYLKGNAVYAGNPAHEVMSLDDYYNKRKNRQLQEAFDYVRLYKTRFGQFPEMKELDEYFFLFFNPKNEEQKRIFESKLKLMQNYENTINEAEGHEAMFSDYESFLKYCKNKIQEN